MKIRVLLETKTPHAHYKPGMVLDLDDGDAEALLWEWSGHFERVNGMPVGIPATEDLDTYKPRKARAYRRQR